MDAEIQRILKNGDLVLRDDVEKFEHNLADFVGTKYAVGLNSCTDGLFLALKVAGIGPGDEVITVSHTFIATIEAIVHCGARPVLVDVGYNGVMDMDEVAKAITPKTKAIIPVHLEGNVCDMAALLTLQGLWNNQFVIIEDAAQALGAEFTVYDIRRKTGSIGLVGCFSFYPAKILGAYGDAGAIVTNDENIYIEIKKFRHHYYVGKNMGVENDFIKYGHNSRLDNLQAAVLNVRFKYLNDYLVRRKEIAAQYDVQLPAQIIRPKAQFGRVYQDYVIRVQNGERDELAQFLKNAGVEVLGTDLIPNHTYKGLGLDFNLPVTEQIYDEQMRLPCNEVVSDAEIQYVIETIASFYE